MDKYDAHCQKDILLQWRSSACATCITKRKMTNNKKKIKRNEKTMVKVLFMYNPTLNNDN